MIKTAENAAESTGGLRKQEKSGHALSLYSIRPFVRPAVCCLLSLMFGRVNFAGTMSPAGIAFCWAVAGRGAVFYPVCLFSFLGYLSRGSADIRQYMASAFITVVLGFVLERRIGKKSAAERALFPAACVLLGGAVYYFASGFDTYIILKSAMEAAIAALLSAVFYKGIVMTENGVKFPLSYAGQAAALAVLSLFIGSFTGLELFGLDIKTMLSVFSILVFGVCFPFASAGFGILLAFVLFLCGGADEAMFGILCLSAFLCGLVGQRGKTACLMAFAAGSAVVAFYTGMESNLMTAVSAVCGAGMFMIFPDRLFKYAGAAAKTAVSEPSEYMKNAKEVFDAQSRGFSEAFRSLAEAFEPEKELTTDASRRRTEAIIDDAAEKICKDCTMSVYCWSVRNCDTLSAFYSLIGQYDKSGSADEGGIPEEFSMYCIKPKKLCAAVNDSCRFLKNSAVWHNRLIRSRSIISEQLYSVAGIIESMAKNINIEDLKSSADAELIKERLLSSGIEAEEVYVYKESSGRTMVNVKRNKCPYKSTDCTAVILPVVNSVCSMSFVKSSVSCSGDRGLCSVTLRQADTFSFRHSESIEKRFDSEVSGDSFMIEENEKGVLTVAVSDGMGSGRAAKEESSKALSLLSRFSSAGFDAGVSAGILNSVLLGRGDGELFTTLDVCCINMYTGRGKLIKNGGSTAFIIRDGKVTAIRSTSLPIGIIGGVESDITEFNLGGGDILLMITDGVADACGGANDERFIESIVKKNRNSDISVLSKAVIDEAKKLQNGQCQDDMMAVCVKIFEKR